MPQLEAIKEEISNSAAWTIGVYLGQGVIGAGLRYLGVPLFLNIPEISADIFVEAAGFIF